MAAFSALKNRQNQKMREKMEDILIRCGDTGHGLELCRLEELLSEHSVPVGEKDKARLDKMADAQGRISREEFMAHGKGSKVIKQLVDKLERSDRPASATPSTPRKDVKIDKAKAAFQAIDKDNSGFIDHEEFLKFTSALPAEKREKLLQNLDKDGDGRLDLEEFRGLFKSTH